MIKLIHGDCLEEMDKLIQEGIVVDAVITDLPYGTSKCDWDNIIPLEPMWDILNKIVKPTGAIVLFGTEPFSSYLRISNIKIYKYDWVFIKSKISGQLNAKKQPMRNMENIMVFYDKQCEYYPQGIKKCFKITPSGNMKSKGKNSDIYGNVKNYKYIQMSTGYPNQVLYIPNNFKIKHPAQKSIALMDYLIRTYTKIGDAVLDFTMGSGTTGEACFHSDRNFIGIELDKKYFEIAKKRIEKLNSGLWRRTIEIVNY